MRIVLVDDHTLFRDGVASLLFAWGHEVVGQAGDGREAVERFRAHASEIACVLRDLAMPRMDGEETFLELRRIQPEVRVVLASGYSDQEIAQRFRSAGLASTR